ncbi:MAG TPA: hypothetical protein VGM81_03810 [Burkholderiaceae bacterium]|jgi:hypothetical protein
MRPPAPALCCPHCTFTIYNRRYPKCEHCGGALPAELRLHHPERRRIQENEIAWQALANPPKRDRRATQRTA